MVSSVGAAESLWEGHAVRLLSGVVRAASEVCREHKISTSAVLYRGYCYDRCFFASLLHASVPHGCNLKYATVCRLIEFALKFERFHHTDFHFVYNTSDTAT